MRAGRVHFRTRSRRRTTFTRTGGQRRTGVHPITGIRTTTTSPSQTEVESSYTPAKTYSVPFPAPSLNSHAGTVMFFSTALLIFATWKSFWDPLIQALWVDLPGSSKTPPKFQWGPELLGFGFVIFLTVLASASPEMGGIILLIVVALWAIFVIFNQDALKAFTDWIVKTSQSGTSVVGGVAGGKFGSGSSQQPLPSSPGATYPPNQH